MSRRAWRENRSRMSWSWHSSTKTSCRSAAGRAVSRIFCSSSSVMGAMVALSPAGVVLDHIQCCKNARLDEFEPWFDGPERAGFLGRDFGARRGRAARPVQRRRRKAAWHLAPAPRHAGQAHGGDARLPAGAARAGPLQGPSRREEAYPVSWEFTRAPMMTMEKARRVLWFGVRAFGPHMTGYVRRRDGLHIWVPRRSYAKLDHLSGRARQYGRRRPAGGDRPARQSDQGMVAEEAAILARALALQAKARQPCQLSQSVGSAAQARPDDLLRSRIALEISHPTLEMTAGSAFVRAGGRCSACSRQCARCSNEFWRTTAILC